MSEYARYYNEERLHGSLDIDSCETPLLAFGRRKATKAIRKDNPKWMEEDTMTMRNNFHILQLLQAFHDIIKPEKTTV